VSYQQLLLKLMEGITEASVRAEIARAFSAIVAGYAAGKLDDAKLQSVLVEFCLDVLATKYPLKDVEELRPEAEEWARKLYRAVRLATIGERFFAASGIRE
jgi:hypothetical protein